MRPTVSILIPVYNTEKYLRECLESVLAQDGADMEIICLNDGSTDGSLAILEEYAARDARIRLISHENIGLGRTRNEMLDAARGEYVMFLDSDDYIAENAVKRAVGCITEAGADIAAFDVQDFDCATGKLIDHSYMRFKPTEECGVICADTHPFEILSFTSTVACNKIYRLDFLRENGLYFDDFPNHEDIYFALAALRKAKSIALLDEKLVYYRRDRSDSLMQTSKRAKSYATKAYIISKKRLEEENLLSSPELIRGFNNKAFGSIRFAFDFCADADAFREMYDELKGGLEELGIDDMRAEDFIKPAEAQSYALLKSCSAEDYLLAEFKCARKTLAEVRVERNSQRAKAASLKTRLEAQTAARKAEQEKVRELKQRTAELKKENAALNKRLKKSEDEVKKIRSSKSFRIARALSRVLTLGGRLRFGR